MENEKIEPNYWAVITAKVRYSKIPANAKLLYGEINALCNTNGYCWASNQYFANLYGVTTQAISKWVNLLAKAGHIKLKYEYNGKEIKQRHIYIIEPEVSTNIVGVSTNDEKGINKRLKGYQQKIKDNNINNNNTYNIDYLKKLAQGKNTEYLEEKFSIAKRDVVIVAEYMIDWINAKGKSYKNYRSAMSDWIRRKIEDGKIKKKDPFMYQDNLDPITGEPIYN
jgi:hypothetical protein